MNYDVIVVGGGPGGSSAAAMLGQAGISTLLLDKSEFPRDKVCGDGLTPQAVYWLDRLGCVEEVLAVTNACLKDCDLYIDGEHVLTGGFTKGTIYPDFAILLDRRRFDHILLKNAVKQGAHFESKVTVRGIEPEGGYVRVHGVRDRKPVSFRGRIVIGADGVSSTVSRAIGNVLKDGVLAVSLRAYYRDVKHSGSNIKVYFDRHYFPGYGWLFVDDNGFANVGLGYAFDRNFPIIDNLSTCFKQFLETDLADLLKGATQCGSVSGGSSGFFPPKAISADHVLLIGDAANQADPLNGGGIHKAMESADCAVEACRLALEKGDFSQATLSRYDELWTSRFAMDWRTAEIFLSIAKNPSLNEFCLFVLKQIGKLTNSDPRFQDFASGIFSGVISQSTCLSPTALYHAFPKDPATWKAFMESNGGMARGTARLAWGTFASMAHAGIRMARNPITNLDWGLEVASKVVRLAERQVQSSAYSG